MQPIKPIRIDLPSDIESVELHPLADLHIGDAMSDWELIQSEIERVLETPNAYCVLNGDLMDTAIASSIGDTYAATHQPMEQLEVCVKLFQPLADAGKILCVVGGNHENRVYKSDGIDMTYLMCKQLGISERYSPTTALIFLRFGRLQKHNHGRKACYSVYMTHGSGGGRKEGGKINRLADYANIVDADAYICSHTHLPAAFKTAFYRVDKSNSSVACVTKAFVNTAAALNYGGYGDKQGYKPASTDNPVLIFGGSKRQIKVEV